METLEYIAQKYRLNFKKPSPIEIPGMTRRDLAALFAELGFVIGAEIGVEQGLYSEVLCRANPGLKLYSVDPWQSYRGYRDHVSQEKLDAFMAAAKTRLAPYNCRITRGFSAEVAIGFDDNSLDFVYIDGNHRLESVIEDISLWSKKVRPGGIVAGHDFKKFKRQTYSHVVEALMAYTGAYRIQPWFVLGKRIEEGRDSARSWMWVKSG